MPTLEANSVDTIVTDPPYGLSFMGKDWDHGVPGVAFWREALRVAKPGAMMLAFGGTRTFHRLTCAIEDAGWEVRDVVSWLYGQGFPKSADISKLIDKQAGAEREIVGRKTGRSATPVSDMRGGHMHAGGTKAGAFDASAITAPATPAAQTWHGWGTALKPAWEPVILAMKPLDGTFAENAGKWGVAGLNVDGARIPITDGATMARNNKPGDNGWKNASGGPNAAALNGEPSGRWPANLLLDEAAAEALDAMSGVSKSTGGGGYRPAGTDTRNGIYGKYGDRQLPGNVGLGDTGGASRFFYVAKASRRDRGEGNIHPTCKPTQLMQYLVRLTSTPTGGVVLDPFMGSGTTGVACMLEGRSFVGIEREAEYIEIARRRIAAAVLPLMREAAD